MTNFKISDFYAISKIRANKCLDPTLSCENRAIKAHSVQNANSLQLIEENNHVFEIKMQLVNGEIQSSFQLVGRKNASTFTGLCADHDVEIFRPIDTKPLSLDDREQLFLLAYRSATRELHTAIEGAMRVEAGYQMLIAQGRVPSDKPTAPGIEAAQHMSKAWGVWKYRYKYFDSLFDSKKFENIKHSVFKIENERPCLASSSLFSVDLKPWGKPFAAVILNAIPTGANETTVVFSYASEHSGKVRRYIAPVMTRKAELRKYELSYMLINRAENFFISPKLVNSWSDEKRRLIVDSFVQPAFGGKPKRKKELMLF